MRRRRFLITTTLLTSLVLAMLLAVVPGLRHRHAGDVTHAHGDSHVHTHDGVTHSHDRRDGWHVHLTLFGFELTLWDSSSHAIDVADAAREPHDEKTNDEHGDDPAADGRPVLLASSPMTVGWLTMFFIDAGPVPARLTLTPVDLTAGVLLPADEVRPSRADTPPVPPPEAA